MTNNSEIESNVPMWEIDGNDTVKEYAYEIAEVDYQLNQLGEELSILNTEADVLERRIDMFFINAFGISDFNQSKYTMLIRENLDIDIYLKEDVDKVKDEDDSVLLQDLSEPLKTISGNRKKVLKILELLNEYNQIITELDIVIEEYNEYVELHKTLWKEIKNIIKNLKYLKLENDDYEIENYDEDKHVLLTVQNENGEWGFRYIRKEDTEEFNKILELELEEIEEN